ncbi:LytR/AlgR family response regulator transcription factor [Kordia jejudonensis]|uniref:LytR/AlgR family response regulator transcription factor n=1 Tax=Kordia jejudonensis TaxID=1348245 RepID=UPI0006299EF5|nr:response regulator transcription factor [Kordia jejudonensis]
MEQLHILLLEDDVAEAQEMISLLNRNDYLVTHVSNTADALKKLHIQHFDMIILDIMIDGKPQGITLAKQLDMEGTQIPFIFLTSMQSRTVFEKAKYTKPFSYLLKPFNEMEFLYTIELAIETHYSQENTLSMSATTAVVAPEFFFVKERQKVVKVNVTTIIYIEVDNKYCHLICERGSYLIKLSLSKIKEILANPDFRQTHRNYLVNVTKIKEMYIEDNLIIMETNHKVPFSGRFKATFLKDGLFFR